MIWVRAFFVLVVATAADDADWDSAWQDFSFVFVGGYHFSGTSVMAQLLSSQPWAVGLSVPKLRLTLDNCANKRCAAPENEGVFLTKAFERHLGPHRCKARQWFASGECARVEYAHWGRVAPQTIQRMRDALWKDWRRFFIGCQPSTRYLVEKDIPNLIRGPLLSEIFGAERVSFVYSLRHPMAARYSRTSKPDFDFSEERRTLEYWLDAHDVALETISRLERVVVLQHERLRKDPDGVLAFVANLIGLKDPTFDYVSPNRRRRLGLHRDSVDRRGLVHILEPTAGRRLWWSAADDRQADDIDHRLGRYCYSLHSLEPLNSSRCARPVLEFKRLRPPLVPRNDTPPPSTCSWPVATDFDGRLMRSHRDPTVGMKNAPRHPPTPADSGHLQRRRVVKATPNLEQRAKRHNKPARPPPSMSSSSSSTTTTTTTRGTRRSSHRRHRVDEEPDEEDDDDIVSPEAQIAELGAAVPRIVDCPWSFEPPRGRHPDALRAAALQVRARAQSSPALAIEDAKVALFFGADEALAESPEEVRGPPSRATDLARLEETLPLCGDEVEAHAAAALALGEAFRERCARRGILASRDRRLVARRKAFVEQARASLRAPISAVPARPTTPWSGGVAMADVRSDLDDETWRAAATEIDDRKAAAVLRADAHRCALDQFAQAIHNDAACGPALRAALRLLRSVARGAAAGRAVEDPTRVPAMVAWYPPGAGYAMHKDAYGPGRELTVLLYLTDLDWKDPSGGVLRIHGPHIEGGALDIAPRLGRVVVFEARTTWHEVLPTASRPRRLLSLWLESSSSSASSSSE
ncbi:hypothetical protein CTAYLR_008484 [Chrysophaeum taylorii]|uniref:Fe2OG dioxygenase domain-containing protein n=1 Tax=Chrysophaeum taylorii TaxID=2483200 RepID=A0AAD7UA83_9STRA|nr:hypothetical protein CTAYLR_008484 [Chrysophaeum taylorii]